MNVLMLGWEFPPFITGGLGTACYGLTKAMNRRGLHITFVVPKPVSGAEAKHVRLLSPGAAVSPRHDLPWTSEAAPPDSGRPASDRAGGSEHASGTEGGPAGGPAASASPPTHPPSHSPEFERVEFIDVPAEFSSPYEASVEAESGDRELTVGGGRSQDVGGQPVQYYRDAQGRVRRVPASGALPVGESETSTEPASMPQAVASGDYDGDIIGQVERYAHFVLGATRQLHFDIIHAHDWMTYPAGMLLARATGKPLVVHIHSTEFDRSGDHVNQRIYDIERRGMHAAMRVVAVSQLTKNMVVSRYAVPSERVEVVYNGVDLEPSAVGITGIRSRDKIVLYFGRITHQKGPEYFIRAAKRVLEVMDNVKFVVAGSGDMAKRMIEMAAELGIGHKVLFTGFLRGHDIKRVFNLADLYVMPSVSEPFGIAPLEAMSHNVPALISKSSGVSEVLQHALKVDFWDVDDMANKIVAVLRHPPLSSTLQEHGAFEVRRLTWDGAAQRCEQVYKAVVGEMVQAR